MATVETSKLILKVEADLTKTGKTAYAQRSFANITPTLADADVYAIGQKLAGLQTGTVAAISRQDVKAFSEGA